MLYATTDPGAHPPDDAGGGPDARAPFLLGAVLMSVVGVPLAVIGFVLSASRPDQPRSRER